MCELPEVAGVKQDVLADSLLQADIVLIADAGLKRFGAEGSENVTEG